MSDARALRRLELSLGILWMTVAIILAVVVLDAIRHHGIALEPPLLMLALAVAIVARALASLVRQLRAERMFLRAVRVTRTEIVHGEPVRVVAGSALAAFCAGVRAPAVYISEGTLHAAGDAELRAIVAHEAHHRVRRDPLRLMLATVVADAMRPLPPFATLAEHEAALADLLADAASVNDARGDRAPLALAFVRFDAVAPERVDRLVGSGPLPTVPTSLLLPAAATLAGLAALAAPMLLAVPHPNALLEPALFAVAFVPACLAAGRAGACLHSGGR